MGGISRQLAILSLLTGMGTPSNNPVATVRVGSGVKPDRDAQRVTIDAHQSQAAAIAANVEFESPVDNSQ